MIFFLEQYNDCVFINLCPRANVLQNNSDFNSIQKLLNSFCGFETVAGITRPKVRTDDDGEMHKNVDLLPDDCGNIYTDRLLGAYYANLYEYPWMALLSYRSRDRKTYEFKCGGTIINSRYVLTSAHCVKDKVLAGVRMGEYDISQRTDCGFYNTCESYIQDVRIEKIIIHEQYDPMNTSVTNDIALLRVKKPIELVRHKNIAPICLPVWKNLQNINVSEKIATVAGWGLAEAGTPSRILKNVYVPIFNETACHRYLNRNSELNLDNPQIKTICAGEARGDNHCNGDPGGPLMIQDQYKDDIRVIQVGIASYGPSQCGSTAPAVYTDVTKYVDWILDNIEA